MQKELKKRGIKQGQKKNVEKTKQLHCRVPISRFDLCLCLVNEQIQEAREDWKIKNNLKK